MSLNELELANEFEGMGDIRHHVHKIHNELGGFGNKMDAEQKKVLKDVVEVLKEGVKILRIYEDNDTEEFYDIFSDATSAMDEFFECACVKIDACGRGSGRGKGGKGLGRDSDEVSKSEYNSKKKAAMDAISNCKKAFEKSGSASSALASSSSSSSDSLNNDLGSLDDTNALHRHIKDKTVKELNKMLIAENIVTHDSDCIRKSSNSGTTMKDYLFESVHFKPNKLMNNVKDFSPKLDALLSKIHDLDEADMRKHGHRFKHFIFSDVKSASHGVKLVASALMASGLNMVYEAEMTNPKSKLNVKPDDTSYNYNSSLALNSPKSSSGSSRGSSNSSSLGQNESYVSDDGDDDNGGVKVPKKLYKKIQVKTPQELARTKGDNFILLSSTAVYQQPLSVAMKKSLLAMFNTRPDNVYGDNARIIIMDGGFKEGIDLFDIKYVHIFEPQTSMADQKQVIGRGTRTCGQKGLVFHPTQGWPLHVYNYDLDFGAKLGEFFMDSKKAIEYYLKSINVDFRLYNFIEDLEQTCIKGSVDYELNKNIHSFSISSGENSAMLGGNSMLGGARAKKTDAAEDFDFSEEHPVVAALARVQAENADDANSDFPKNITYKNMQKYIREHFSEYSWNDVKMENLCGYEGPESAKQMGGGTIMKYTPTQAFVSNYFTPQIPLKGMLLWHSVGTGKTCTAIATASSMFESMGYTILWVTRTTLKNDIWKNMFDQICNESIKKKQLAGVNIPAGQTERMRLLSKSWSIRPMSYKQFSNMVLKKNKFYSDLVKKNGSIDPLRKTLLIIDEAHKLYGGGDLSSIEKPDMDALYASLLHSYATSGKDSVKLMLMTATPITQSPMELIKLVNLFKEPRDHLPTDFGLFSEKYLNDAGNFTNSGEKAFLDCIAGHISYLNREKDARQFSQPIIKQVAVPILNKKTETMAKAFDDMEEFETERRILQTQAELERAGEAIDVEVKSFNRNKLLHLLDKCESLEYPSKIRQCKKNVRGSIKEIQATVRQFVNDKKQEIKNVKERLKTIRKIPASTRKRISRMKKLNPSVIKKTFRHTPYFKLKKVCRNSVKTNTQLSGIVDEQPEVIQLIEKQVLKTEELNAMKEKVKNELNAMAANIKQLNAAKTKNKDKMTEEEKKMLTKSIDEYKILREDYKSRTDSDIYRANFFLKENLKHIKKSKGTVRKNIEKRIKLASKKLTKKMNAEEKELVKIEKARKTAADAPLELKNQALKGIIDEQEKYIDDLIEELDAQPGKEELREAEKQRKQEEKARIAAEKKEAKAQAAAEKKEAKAQAAAEKKEAKAQAAAEKARIAEEKKTQRLEAKAAAAATRRNK